MKKTSYVLQSYSKSPIYIVRNGITAVLLPLYHWYMICFQRFLDINGIDHYSKWPTRSCYISLYFSDTEISSFWGHFRHRLLGFSVDELRLCLHHYHPISWRRGFYRRRSTSGGETGWLFFGLFQYDSSTYWPSLLIRLASISQYDVYSQLDCLAMTEVFWRDWWWNILVWFGKFIIEYSKLASE